MNVTARWSRKAAAVAGALTVTLLMPSCSFGEGPGGDAQTMRDALERLDDAGAFRMTGELRSANGDKAAFDAHLDGRGNCRGTINGAESVLVGDQVWTRWEDEDLRAAVASLSGNSIPPLDPVTPEGEDDNWTATRLLQGAYLVTDLPSDNAPAAGIAPVCQAGQFLAGAANSDADVTSGPAVTSRGERLRRLSRVQGPVTVRVYVPESGKPVAHRAEYIIDGNWSLSARLNNLGKPVTVTPPARNLQTVAAEQILRLFD
ncbi:hypothetical protein [Streptomyces fructofermentans]|nr:hypothetical protein [Streptomyces fructofermentans]